ncbi:Zinc finger, PHD-type [Sesbania bispinosa]|nr:Zinc finger, PHD-type [Sesbania bispinosa]
MVKAVATEAQTTSANPAGMDLDLPVDPNEPTYCFCNQVSYGEMVACDNPDCKIEWFHFGCVGLKEHPKGKWYCSNCAATRNRRRGPYNFASVAVIVWQNLQISNDFVILVCGTEPSNGSPLPL